MKSGLLAVTDLYTVHGARGSMVRMVSAEAASYPNPRVTYVYYVRVLESSSRAIYTR